MMGSHKSSAESKTPVRISLSVDGVTAYGTPPAGFDRAPWRWNATYILDSEAAHAPNLTTSNHGAAALGPFHHGLSKLKRRQPSSPRPTEILQILA